MNRILGVDYGTRRVGLAISDPLGMLATPLSVETVRTMDEAVGVVCRVARERRVERCVVGIPINMDGTRGPMAIEAAQFADQVRAASGLPVDLTDERLSTSMVERVLLDADLSRGRRKEVRDKLAAQVILQGYLDAREGMLPDEQDTDQAPDDPR